MHVFALCFLASTPLQKEVLCTRDPTQAIVSNRTNTRESLILSFSCFSFKT